MVWRSAGRNHNRSAKIVMARSGVQIGLILRFSKDDLIDLLMLVDEGDHGRDRWSSSANAKGAPASRPTPVPARVVDLRCSPLLPRWRIRTGRCRLRQQRCFLLCTGRLRSALTELVAGPERVMVVFRLNIYIIFPVNGDVIRVLIEHAYPAPQNSDYR